MNKTVLYVYGYGSNAKDSTTMNEVKQVMKDLGYNLISIDYDQKNPDESLNMLENFIKDNEIKYVIGHSLGGYLVLCMNLDIKKLVINPCMKPQFELPKITEVSSEMIYNYEILDEWLYSGADSPWGIQIEEVMGIFSDHDELIDFYDMFKKQYPKAYKINAGHKPKKEAFTENIKEKIKESFS